MRDDHFFIVYRVESKNPQRRFTISATKHATQLAARREAERLAEEHVGATFAVMGVLSTHRSKTLRRRVST